MMHILYPIGLIREGVIINDIVNKKADILDFYDSKYPITNGYYIMKVGYKDSTYHEDEYVVDTSPAVANKLKAYVKHKHEMDMEMDFINKEVSKNVASRLTDSTVKIGDKEL
jgi:hypothetical protein